MFLTINKYCSLCLLHYGGCACLFPLFYSFFLLYIPALRVEKYVDYTRGLPSTSYQIFITGVLVAFVMRAWMRLSLLIQIVFLLFRPSPQQSGKPISPDEVTAPISQLKLSNSPGPDGLAPQYYTCFADILISHFLMAFDAKEETSSSPTSLLQAYMTVIPKEGKDPAHCAVVLFHS